MQYLQRFGFVLVIIMVGFACSDSTTGTGSGSGSGDSNGNGDQGQNGSEDTETTVEDDKDNIQASVDNTVASLKDLRNGKFANSVEAFFGSSQEWVGDVSGGLGDIFSITFSQDNIRFDYSSKTGVYEWDRSTAEFSEPSSSNDIVVHFPSSESSSSNDAQLTVGDYSDESTTIDGDQYYLPTLIQSELKLDGDPVFGFDLNEVQYSDDESLPIPSTVELEIFTAPFTHSLTFDRSEDTNFSFSFDMTNNDQLAAGISLDLELAHSEFNTLQEGDLEILEGSLKFGQDLSVDFSVEDLGKLVQFEDPSENDVNSLVNAEVLYQDEKVGDLEYSEEEETIMIIYSDGSSESVEQYFKDVESKKIPKLEAFTEDWVNFAN